MVGERYIIRHDGSWINPETERKSERISQGEDPYSEYG